MESGNMMDDKKLKDSELEQVCGGDDGGTGPGWKSVVNPKGTDFCREPKLQYVRKHLNKGTKLKLRGRFGISSKVSLESGEIGYVLSQDIH